MGRAGGGTPDEGVRQEVFFSRSFRARFALKAAYGVLIASALAGLSPPSVRATEMRLVYSSPFPDGAPSWEPGNRRIAFTSTMSGDWEVWIVDALGGEAFDFSQLPDTTDIYANWSRDGASIAYSSKRNNGHGQGDYDLWMQSVGTRELRCLTSWEGYDNWAALDPSGTKVAFVSDRGGEMEIWRMPLDASSPAVKLSTGPVECHHPCWSPDGAWIAFDGFSQWGDSQRRLYRLPAAGGGAEEIPTGLILAEDPDWSPSGRYLAFDGGSDPASGDLWLWDFQEQSLIQLTDTRYAEQSPVWNDAETEIACAVVIGEDKDVWVAYDLPIQTSAESTSWGDLKLRFGP